ncbi:ATP-binding cassette A2 [Actinidia rufa]|uniref:ATP-binding cassette A2 n=1 Tax=Actinidia rufa TaxID=165716 RepID=A0A7J0GAA6_9ERIC|nr:ATP-binding cassette A2 [Actinidia rufa]
MALRRGIPLLIQQFRALFTKNLILSWRSKRSTFLQLFSSLFFLFLIFCIQKAMESRFASTTSFENVFDPKAVVTPPIPPCEDKFYVKLPCFDFVWSGSDNPRIGSIVDRIRENNPGRPIPLNKVQAFRTKSEVDQWLFSNPMSCPGALHFVERNATVITYGIQTNSTPVERRGHYEDPTFKYQIPLQIAAEREIARSLIGDANFSWVVNLKEFAHPALEIFSALGTIGPTFFLAIAMFGFVFQISSLITEKELKLRQLITQFGFPYTTDFSDAFRIIWSLFPPNLLAQGLTLLSDATATPEDPGISWSRRGKCAPNDEECVITINEIFIWLLSTFLVWFVLAIYFDNIIPNSSGVRKSVFYFLNPGYWTGKGGNKVSEGGICSCISSVPRPENSTPDDEDVVEEENTVKQQAREGIVDTNIAAQLQGLVKTYPGTTTIGCCKCKKTSHYHALKFDILWDALSGREHLHLFAGIKGLPPASIKSVAEKSLAEVRLTEAARTRAGSYSGGMKRRLSVAIALIGDPKLVILDEPTTGMDPITRRHVWDIIEDAKKGRAIILTTHSMEEADILSDRIGIMAKGRLRCIGTSIRLKSKFGTGFIANVSFSGGANGNAVRGEAVTTMDHEPVKQFFKNRLDVVPKEENKSFLTYVIPHDREKLLTNFFAELQDREREFGISDIQLGLTTLEEVFLNIAKQAELESAAAEGSLATLTLTSGTSVQIPVGARFIGIPRTESAENPRGVMVEVYWEQDDSGALCISGHSPETPIPPDVQLRASSTATAQRNVRSRAGVHGIVIDPNQIGTAN